MARPGVSRSGDPRWFSPHARGWPPAESPSSEGNPVLPARAGMARINQAEQSRAMEFSPHARGWPEGPGPTRRPGAVLPARAGMARNPNPNARRVRRFSPHARGWPAREAGDRAARLGFSPHARGWPVQLDREDVDGVVLPARAGMARRNLCWGCCGSRSPRTRGDGPLGPLSGALGALVLPARAGMAQLSA